MRQKAGQEENIKVNDANYMQEALKEAENAYRSGNFPVGALLVMKHSIIARSGNRERELHDPTAHAEILVIREAGRKLGTHRLPGSIIYTTLEPCPMCTAAMSQARVSKVVYGTRALRWTTTNLFNLVNVEIVQPRLNDGCRQIVQKWCKENGRNIFLDHSLR